MINGKSSNGKWYDLSGRKLSGQPSKGGIYIVNGKKILYQSIINMVIYSRPAINEEY